MAKTLKTMANKLKLLSKEAVLPNQTIYKFDLEGGFDPHKSTPVEGKFGTFPAGQNPIVAWVTSDFKGKEMAELHYAIQNLNRNGFTLWVTNCLAQGRYAIGTISVVVLHS